jgi:hypothetical protein
MKITSKFLKSIGCHFGVRYSHKRKRHYVEAYGTNGMQFATKWAYSTSWVWDVHPDVKSKPRFRVKAA